MGELKKLGLKPPSRNTVKKIMKEAGHDPGPSNMFIKEFDSIIENSGAEVKKVGPRAANMSAFIERSVQSIQQEALDHFIVFGEDHFNYLVSEYVAYYQTVRPHQSLDNKPLTGNWPDPESGEPPDAEIICHKRLGGLLKHYSRKAT